MAGLFDGQHEVIPFELGFVDFDFGDCLFSKPIGLLDPFVFGFGDVGLRLRKADFDIIFPAIVSAFVGGIGRFLLGLGLAVVDLADRLAGPDQITFLHAELHQNAGFFRGKLDVIGHFEQPGHGRIAGGR